MLCSKDLVKSTTSNVVSQGIIMAASFAYVAYLARVFSEKEMAIYAVLNIMTGWNELLTSGSLVLLNRDAARLMASGETGRLKTLLSGVLVWRTLVLILICQCWVFASAYIANSIFKDAGYAECIRYVAYISIALVFRSMLSAAQAAVQHFTSRSLVNVIAHLAQQGLSLGSYVIYGIDGFLTGFLCGTFVGIFLSCWDMRNYFTARIERFSVIFRESMPFIGLQFLEGALDKADRPLIGAFLGVEMLAAYHIARRLYENLYMATSTVLEPMVVKIGEVLAEGKDPLNKYYRQTVLVTAQVFIPISFLAIATAKPFLSLYAGAKYAYAYPIVMAFGFTLLGISMWSTLRAAALRLIAAQFLAYQTIIFYAVTLAGYAVLLPACGPIGIPIAMGLGYFAGWTLAMPLKKHCGVTTPWRELYTGLGCGACMLTAILPMSLFENRLWQLFVGLILGGAIYLLWVHWVGPREIDVRLRRLYAALPLPKFITGRA